MWCQRDDIIIINDDISINSFPRSYTEYKDLRKSEAKIQKTSPGEIKKNWTKTETLESRDGTVEMGGSVEV